MRRRKVNYRALLLLLVSGALLGVAVHFVHGYQVRRQAEMFRREAQRLEETGQELDRALDLYGRYLAMHRDDAETLAHYALLLESLARNTRQRQQAFLLLETALRQSPDRRDLRERAVALAGSLGRHSDAIFHLQELLDDSPDDAALVHEIGECQERAGQFKEAEESYRKAIQQRPGQVDSYMRLAYLLRNRREDRDQADMVIKEMIRANPEKGVMAQTRYLIDFKERDALAEAAKELARGQGTPEGEDPERLLVLTEAALLLNRPDEARGHLQRGLQLHPQEVRFHLMLAQLELQAGQRDKALTLLRQAKKLIGDKVEEIGMLADLFVDAGETAEATDLLLRLGREGVRGPIRDYLQARIHMSEERWLHAASLLERSQKDLAGSGELSRRALLHLAVCYRELGNADLQLAACQRALERDGGWLPARLVQAEALTALGRLEDALALYRAIMDRSPDARLQAVRLMLLLNRRSTARRSWQVIEATLKDAPEHTQTTADWALLWAEVQAAQNHPDEAAKLLEAARTAHPKEVRIWLALADLAQAQQKPDEVFRHLDRGEKVFGKNVDLQLARARHLLAAKREKEARDYMAGLERNVAEHAREDQVRLLTGLGNLYLGLEASAEAEQVWIDVARRKSHDVRPRLVLFNLALESNQGPVMRKLVQEVRDIEGPDGALWRYCEAARLIVPAESNDGDWLGKARQLLEEVGKRRPSWSAALAVEARLEEQAGQIDEAIAKYTRAIDQGERSLDLVRRLLVLLNQQRRYPEAQALLQKVQKDVALSPDLAFLAARLPLPSLALRRDFMDMAEKGLSPDSKDFRDLLMLGAILHARGKTKEAEQAYRRAVELADERPEPWVSLVLFLVATDQKQRAEEVVEVARRRLPVDAAPLALAACYEGLNQDERAEQSYQEALRRNLTDTGTLRAVAGYYMRAGKDVQAEKILRQILAARDRLPLETLLWARRALAFLLALRGYQPSLEAQELIRENLKARPNSPEDLRAQAAVLVVQPGKVRESIRVLESAYLQSTPSPSEQFLLARMHDSTGNWARARELMLGLLVDSERDNPVFLAYYVARLLEHPEHHGEVPIWLGRLEAREPKSYRTLDLNARWLTKQNRRDKAVELLRAFASDAKESESKLVVALLLDELQLDADLAERLYQAVVAERKDKNPDVIFYLAQHYALRKEIDRALDLCESAWHVTKPENVAALCVAVLRTGQPDDRQISRVEKRLQAELGKNDRSTRLLRLLADLREMQGRYDEAEKLYRRILDIDALHLEALNNLAGLLALRERETAEAMVLMQRLIDRAGPVPNFLDTRAMVALAAGDGRQAVKDLETALATEVSPVGYFHLARAYQLLQDRKAAWSSFQKARSLGLKPGDLHPLERPILEGMERDLTAASREG